MSHERGKDWGVFTTSGTYPWSFVTFNKNLNADEKPANDSGYGEIYCTFICQHKKT
jgi:hypothetical protein